MPFRAQLPFALCRSTTQLNLFILEAPFPESSVRWVQMFCTITSKWLRSAAGESTEPVMLPTLIRNQFSFRSQAEHAILLIPIGFSLISCYGELYGARHENGSFTNVRIDVLCLAVPFFWKRCRALL